METQGTDNINNLGITLVRSAEVDVDNQVAAGRISLYFLQRTRLCSDGIHPDTVRYIWNAETRPLLTYGL